MMQHGSMCTWRYSMTIMETPTLVIENFRKPVDTPVVSIDDDSVTALRKAYEGAGLTALASTVDARAATVQRLDTARLLFPELSDGDTATWKGFLPTSYAPDRYGYDFPSRQVATLIADASALGVFDRIEIWTPEGSDVMLRVKEHWNRQGRTMRDALNAAIDPMAVGVIEHNGRTYYYPVVRWGESLVSFSRIKTLVRVRNVEVFLMTRLPVILLVATVAGLVAWGFIATWVAMGPVAILMWLGVAVLVFAGYAIMQL